MYIDSLIIVVASNAHTLLNVVEIVKEKASGIENNLEAKANVSELTQWIQFDCVKFYTLFP